MNVSWIHPRVLSPDQLNVLVGKIDGWSSSILAMEKLIEKNANDILTM